MLKVLQYFAMYGLAYSATIYCDLSYCDPCHDMYSIISNFCKYTALVTNQVSYLCFSLRSVQQYLWETGNLRIDLRLFLKSSKAQAHKERSQNCKLAPVEAVLPSGFTASHFARSKAVVAALKTNEKPETKISNPESSSSDAASEKLQDAHESPEKEDKLSGREVAKPDPEGVSKLETPSEVDSPGEERKTEEKEKNAEEVVQKAAASKDSDQTANLRVEGDEKMSYQTKPEQPGVEKEIKNEISDSPKDNAATDEPSIVTSTKAGSGKTEAEDEEPKKDDSLVEGKLPLTRESQEDGEKTPQMDVPLQESSAAETCEAVVTDPGEEEGAYLILDAVDEEDAEEAQTTTKTQRSRGPMVPPEKEAEKKPDDTEKMDSAKVEPVPEASATEGSGRKRAKRGVKADKKPLNRETIAENSNSLKNEGIAEEPVVTRSTRSRRGKAKMDAEEEESKKDDAPARRKPTLREKTPKTKTPQTKDRVPVGETSSTQTGEAAVTDLGEEEGAYVIIDAVEEEDAEEEPTEEETKRNKKPTRASQSEDVSCTAADEDDLWQILDSLDDGAMDEEAHAGESKASQDHKNREKTADKSKTGLCFY